MLPKEILTIVALGLLGLCLISALAKAVMKKDKDKKKCNMACSLMLFIAAVLIGISQLLTETNTDNYESSRATLKVLSANSWCGYSKKMSAQEDELKGKLAKIGVNLEMINDTDDKAKFDKESKTAKARGFPHAILVLSNGQKKDISGYMPSDKMVAKVKSMM
jgi:thiol-disulfide isomerase/thioredoxin